MASTEPASPSAKARITGLLLIVVVAIIWVCASFIVQQLKLHPLLITYFCNVLFLVYLPISVLQASRWYEITYFGFGRRSSRWH